MTANDIKAEIARQGTTQSAIARYLGVTPGTVAKVIHGKVRSARVEAEIEQLMGRQIFPPKLKTGRTKSVWNGVAAQRMSA